MNQNLVDCDDSLGELGNLPEYSLKLLDLSFEKSKILLEQILLLLLLVLLLFLFLLLLWAFAFSFDLFRLLFFLLLWLGIVNI